MALTPRAVFTDDHHGDLAVTVDRPTLDARRRAIHPARWTWLDQVHGAEVVVVTRPGEYAGAAADAAVTAVAGAPLAVHTADCAPILLEGDGVIGVVHGGWRGLLGGVIEATAEAMADLGGPARAATLGPCIRARCYEFGEADLAAVAARYGPGVVAETAWGTPALDLVATVRAACTWLEVELGDVAVCTACSSNHRSHRARGDSARQALVAWLDEDPGPAVSVRPPVGG